MPAKSFYGSPTKTFLEMPTTLLQVHRRTFGRLRGVPQVSRHLLWRLREVPQVFRHLLWRLRVLPQVPRHLLWRLRESRKSLGICFDVCGKSRKCFGEPVGRYSMLSMTFSIRVSHSFVELTLYNTDIKPYRANPYVKRTPHALLSVKRNTRTDLHPDKMRANPTKHSG